MNRILISLVVGVALLFAGSFAHASLINQLSGPPFGVAQTGGGAFTTTTAINSSTPQINGIANAFQVELGNITPWAWLSATATDLFQAMSVQVQMVNGFGGGTSHTYPFQVTLTNNLPIWHHPIQNVEFRLVNSDVPAADWAGIGFVSPFSSTYNSATYNDGKSLMFGGQNGGGGQFLASDGPQTLSFGLYLPAGIQGGQNFFLEMVPNPEPTSLLLGAVALIGGVVMTRRRKTKAVADAQPQV